jgi:hypothetical protein
MTKCAAPRLPLWERVASGERVRDTRRVREFLLMRRPHAPRERISFASSPAIAGRGMIAGGMIGERRDTTCLNGDGFSSH